MYLLVYLVSLSNTTMAACYGRIIVIIMLQFTEGESRERRGVWKRVYVFSITIEPISWQCAMNHHHETFVTHGNYFFKALCKKKLYFRF